MSANDVIAFMTHVSNKDLYDQWKAAAILRPSGGMPKGIKRADVAKRFAAFSGTPQTWRNAYLNEKKKSRAISRLGSAICEFRKNLHIAARKKTTLIT